MFEIELSSWPIIIEWQCNLSKWHWLSFNSHIFGAFFESHELNRVINWHLEIMMKRYFVRECRIYIRVELVCQCWVWMKRLPANHQSIRYLNNKLCDKRPFVQRKPSSSSSGLEISQSIYNFAESFMAENGFFIALMKNDATLNVFLLLWQRPN